MSRDAMIKEILRMLKGMSWKNIVVVYNFVLGMCEVGK